MSLVSVYDAEKNIIDIRTGDNARLVNFNRESTIVLSLTNFIFNDIDYSSSDIYLTSKGIYVNGVAVDSYLNSPLIEKLKPHIEKAQLMFDGIVNEYDDTKIIINNSKISNTSYDGTNKVIRYNDDNDQESMLITLANYTDLNTGIVYPNYKVEVRGVDFVDRYVNGELLPYTEENYQFNKLIDAEVKKIKDSWYIIDEEQHLYDEEHGSSEEEDIISDDIVFEEPASFGGDVTISQSITIETNVNVANLVCNKELIVRENVNVESDTMIYKQPIHNAEHSSKTFATNKKMSILDGNITVSKSSEFASQTKLIGSISVIRNIGLSELIIGYGLSSRSLLLRNLNTFDMDVKEMISIANLQVKSNVYIIMKKLQHIITSLLINK